MKVRRRLFLPVFLLTLFFSCMTVSANTGMEWSSTGEGWTTDLHNMDIYEGTEGETVTIQPVQRPVLLPGQHYYKVNKHMDLPIARWELRWTDHYCIHNSYPAETDHWKGFAYSRNPCLRDCQPGWIAICADCGEEIGILIYATKDTVSSIDTFSTTKPYVSVCVDPNCNNLEMGAAPNHKCDVTSWNRYQIQYMRNGATGGYMSPRYYYYDNHNEYNGETVDVKTTLDRNQYHQTGLVFTGWNTKPDGSGISIADGEDWLSVQSKLDLANKENNSIHKLYAQWVPAYGNLRLDMAGGSYNGQAVATIHQMYNSSYQINTSQIVAPAGNRVSFVTNGGSAVGDIYTTRYFSGWIYSEPFYGYMPDDGNNLYTFGVDYRNWYNGCTDTLTAQYGSRPVTLPGTTKSGEHFGGWYKDSVQDWSTNSGKGAVDLSWVQNDNTDKVFRVYQKREDASVWSLLSPDASVNGPTDSKEWGYSGAPVH